jgi:hypothetical protein
MPAITANTPSAASPIPRSVLVLRLGLVSSLEALDLDEDEPEDEDEVSLLGPLLLGVAGAGLPVESPDECVDGGFVPELP